jgi:hypothetical protein
MPSKAAVPDLRGDAPCIGNGLEGSAAASATRYDKLATNFLLAVAIATIIDFWI